MKFFFILLILPFCSAGNEVGKPFVLEGKINIDSGEISIFIGGNAGPEMASVVLDTKKIKVAKGRFVMSGQISATTPVQLYFLDRNGSQTSDLLFIGPGKQLINWDLKKNKIIIIKGDLKTNDSYLAYKEMTRPYSAKYGEWISHMQELTAKSDNKIPDSIEHNLFIERDNIFSMQDSILLQYVRSMPESPVGLWKLCEVLFMFGYKKIYHSIYTSLSPNLQQGKTGTLLLNKLRSARKTAIGEILIVGGLKNFQETASNLVIDKSKKLILIDFWFANCSSCISEFPAWKTTFDKFKDQGFDMVSITIDRRSDLHKAKELVQKHGLTWAQAWDNNGNLARKLSINAYPTNFLVNQDMRILKKNIRPEDVDQYLTDHLSKTRSF